MRPSHLSALALVCLSGCLSTQHASRPEAEPAASQISNAEDASTTEGTSEASVTPMAFETYQLVLLRRDERWQDDPARDLSALQKAHLHEALAALRQLRAEDIARSEEHTSELQSRENLVCRLLLEKK